jgi:hypothetical protein
LMKDCMLYLCGLDVSENVCHLLLCAELDFVTYADLRFLYL